MPRAMPPATGGGPAAGSNLCRPELGVADAEVAAGIWRASKIAGNRTDRAICGRRGLGRCRRWLRRLCRCRGRRCAAPVSAHHVFRPDRPLRTEIDPCGHWPCPVWLCQHFDRLGKPPAVVLVLQDTRAAFLQPPTASAAAQASAIRKCAKSRDKTADPRRIICLSLKTYFASSPWQAASPGRSKGYRRGRPLAWPWFNGRVGLRR